MAIQDQLFGDHGKPRIYANKRKTDNTDALARYRADPEYRKRWQRNSRNRYYQRYGITHEDYDQMLERQQGLCAVCRQPPNAKTNQSEPRLFVDHCHATGKVRALLCQLCNTALGCAKDQPGLLRDLAAYLERFQGESF